MTTEQRLERLEQRLEALEKSLKQMQPLAIAGLAVAAMALLLWAVG